MKTVGFACALMLACALPSYGQLVLSPGQVWDYSFDNLPKTGSVPVFGNNPGGTLQFTVNGSSFQPGDMVRYEMFENSSSEAAICSGTMSSAPPFDATCTRDFSWQDRQGVIRFTMESGSVTIDSITLKAIVAGPSLSSYDVYSTTFTPVPEPGMLTLLVLSAAGPVIWRLRQPHHTNSKTRCNSASVL